jgi:hypothetical protein
VGRCRCRRFSYFAKSLFENVCCVGCAGQWDKGLSPRCALKPRHNNNAICTICTEWKSLIWQACIRIRTAGLSRKKAHYSACCALGYFLGQPLLSSWIVTRCSISLKMGAYRSLVLFCVTVAWEGTMRALVRDRNQSV